MKEIKGDIWEYAPEYDAICCTTNSVVKINGELVMGVGIAKQFANKYPWLPKEWGQRVRKIYPCSPLILLTLMKQKPHLIYFQTKTDWKKPSDIKLIQNSFCDLCSIIDKLNLQKVLLPRPGCENGGLDWKTMVYPTIKILWQQYSQITIISR